MLMLATVTVLLMTQELVPPPSKTAVSVLPGMVPLLPPPLEELQLPVVAQEPLAGPTQYRVLAAGTDPDSNRSMRISFFTISPLVS